MDGEFQIMARKWTSFDAATTNKEFAALPTEDFLSLTEAMLDYRRERGVGYRVESYGGGLLMITDSGRGQGRCLFFTTVQAGDQELLVALLIYKKETARAPQSIVDTARVRMESARKGF